MPETELVAKLSGTSAVTDLVGDRIYPITARQGVALPYVTYQLISGAPVNHAAGTTTTEECRIQVDNYASTYSGVKALAAAVEDALSGWSDAAGTPPITMCHLESRADLSEPIEPGSDTMIHRVSHDYVIWYSTA